MDLSVHCCFILLTGSFAPGILAQVTASPASVTVNPSTVKLGNDALMTFTFTPRESEGVKYVSWHKGVDSSIGDNVLVSTVDGDIGLTNGRYSFDSSNYLVISNATVEDAGSYLCSVVATSGETPQGFSTLTVHYLETPDLELKEKSFKAGETATFTCTSPNGVPTPITITWIKDGDVLDVSDTAKYSQSNTTLEIGRVNEMDEGDYQCRAENAAYSGDEGRLSNKGTLTVIPSVPTVINSPTTTLTTKATSTKSSQQPVTHETTVTSTSSGGSEAIKYNTVIIIGVVIGLVVLVAVIVGAFSYKHDKLCFIRNATKASGGGSEKMVLSSNFSDVDTNTNAQVQKPKQVKAAESEHSEQAVTQTKPPDKPQRAPSRDRANVEQITYADLDFVKNEAKVIRTDPETEYPSVKTEKQLTYADLDLTKDVNTGSKDKIIRTQPETEYSSVMITKK